MADGSNLAAGDLLASCKDWSQSIESGQLPPTSPWLMLSDNVNDKVLCSHTIKQRRNEDIKPRSFFNLSTGKTYEFELPEASGRRCLGVGHGWLLTIGVDLNINLLHPFSRQQIPLPPMLALPLHYAYDDDFLPEEVFDMFIEKAALSANPKSSNDSNTSVMVIYGERRLLAVARLGDKVWTKVFIGSMCFDDVVFYRGKYYVVDCHGFVFVCNLGNNESTSATAIAPTPSDNHIGSKGGFRNVVFYRGKHYVEGRYGYELVSSIENDKISSATVIARPPSGTKDWFQKYLVEFSGDLLLVQRIRGGDEITSKVPSHVVFDSVEEDYEKEEDSYDGEMLRDDYTIKFLILKLKERRCKEEGGSKYPYGWVKVNSLGNKSLFIGWNQSVSLSASEEGGIKPNCIYFTDDEGESFCLESGGRDTGIYHMESGITEPILQSPSLHRYSPPFWYI